jgi:hypothetical protein
MNDLGTRSPRLLVLLVALLTASCLQGPRAFRASHALHNEALRVRVDEELLLNLVRLRYRDSPLFLQVGSVVTQFEVSGSLGANGSLVEAGPGSLGVSAGVGWSEQPTYTFTPLQDDEFVRRLLTPLDLELVVLLQRSGWSIARVLRLTVQNFAGLDNATSASGPTPESAPDFVDFLRLTRALRGLQRRGGIALVYEERPALLSPPIESAAVLGADLVEAAQNGLRFRPAEGSSTQLVLTKIEKAPVLLVAPSMQGSAELQEFAGALGLDSGGARFELVVGVGASEGAPAGGALNVSMRSLLGMFFYLSHGIDVPAEHAATGLVTLTRDAEGRLFDWRRLTGDILSVKTSTVRPERAAVAVPYRGHWFYIEESDLESKSTLALLIELLNMSADEDLGAAPTLTLAVGG